jgi:hypothetical protein
LTTEVLKLAVAGRETKTLLGAKQADVETVWSGWQRISVLGQFVSLLEIMTASRREKACLGTDVNFWLGFCFAPKSEFRSWPLCHLPGSEPQGSEVSLD